MKVTLIIILMAVLAGCSSTLKPNEFEVKPVSKEEVSKCNYIDDVHGTSGLYGMFASQGYLNAQLKALNIAKENGATHIVWIPLSQGYCQGSALLSTPGVTVIEQFDLR